MLISILWVLARTIKKMQKSNAGCEQAVSATELFNFMLSIDFFVVNPTQFCVDWGYEIKLT